MNSTKINKVQLSNMYGKLIDTCAPEPTIRFGVNGCNTKWGTELCDDMSDAHKLTFIKDMADITMSQICYNRSYISQIRSVTKNYPIFDTYHEHITKVDKTYAKIVANWICHFIDPSVLCVASIQDMVVFMVYQFGYIDNLKAFVHYDFSNYEDRSISDNNKFIFSEYDEDLHFLDKRYVSTNPAYSNDVDVFVMDSLNGFVAPTDPVMDLVEVVTSCCNRYYFEYGWHFHYPDTELLSTCEIPEYFGYFWNTYTAREKIGLSNKDQKESHKQSSTNISILDIECLRTYMKFFVVRTQKFVDIYPYIGIHMIFETFMRQCKSSNDTQTLYAMVTFTDRAISTN